MVFYLVFINFATLAVMYMDKAWAQSGSWRVPERTLFYFVLAGGGIGGMAGMRLFRHKTRKPMFYIGFPVITALEYAALFVIWLL